MTTTFDGDVIVAASNDVISSRSGEPPSAPIIEPEVLNFQRSRFLAGRLRAALSDLCARVPEAWVTATPKGIDFERLTIRQCDRLVRALEDAARAFEDADPDRRCVQPNPQQLSLFDGDR